MFSTILTAFDGSAPSERALRLGCELALRFDATLHIVHAAETDQVIVASHPGVGAIPARDELLLEAGEETLANAKAIAAEEGATVSSAKLAQGPASHIILAEIETVGSDLLVMGRQGRGALERFLLGSVSRQVTSDADCACLTVK